MTLKTLSLVNHLLTDAGIAYALHTYKSNTVRYPYWIGEYTEGSPDEETGYRKSTLILTGTTNGTWSKLKAEKDVIEDLFRDRRAILDNGHAVAFYVENSLEIPTQLDTIKRIQLNITVMEWRK